MNKHHPNFQAMLVDDVDDLDDLKDPDGYSTAAPAARGRGCQVSLKKYTADEVRANYKKTPDDATLVSDHGLSSGSAVCAEVDDDEAPCCACARLMRQQTTPRACANARTPTITHLAIAHSCLPLGEEGGCGYEERRWARTPVICRRGMVAWECRRGGSPADHRRSTGGSPVGHHELSMGFMNQRGFSVNHVDKHKPSANQHEPR